ncbi:CoA-transferase subunit beta [Wenjunlia tyrosinilytica]|uniref:CoA-transferase n=1 Tax=Wenjunlia tyrosinilytica TaxID=1544741 RepID=A0A918DX53_9ACTN|nr:CoA-transferase [Wenjunlia tyrosinilytica]GGO86749.1 CoA-transferase [Wenjunlia tyrosinilytica]
MTATRAEVCVAACAEAFRGDGEILAGAMGGLVPSLGARLARATFEPDLVISDGQAYLVDAEQAVEGWLPYRAVLDLLASGRRHVMMGPVQIDAHGNANISCIGPWERPKRQLLGARGAPGNTVNHTTSYWIPRHAPRVLTPRVDLVCGIGYDRAASAGYAARFHEIRRVVTDLAVLDFAPAGPMAGDGGGGCGGVGCGGGVPRMRLASVHPGVTVDQVVEATGFELTVPGDVPTTPAPDPEALRILRDVLDPAGAREAEVPGG